MSDWKNDRVKSAEDSKNPMVLVKMRSGYAVIGDTQFLPGYCVLLGSPKANCLNDLSMQQRSDYLVDMTIIGDAITAVCNPIRVNYDILGNTDAFLHAHIFPRYEWETEERRRYPVWLYPKNSWTDAEYQYNEERHGDMKNKLAEKIMELMKESY